MKPDFVNKCKYECSGVLVTPPPPLVFISRPNIQVTLHGIAFGQFRLVLLSHDILSSSAKATTFHKVTFLIYFSIVKLLRSERAPKILGVCSDPSYLLMISKV